MAIVSIKTQPYRYPNFVHLELADIPGQAKGDAAMDVAHAFPSDAEAERYWDELKAGWVQHVKERRCANERAALSASGGAK